MKLIIDKNISFIHSVFDSVCDVSCLPSGDIDNKAVKDADALIVRTRTHCDKALLDGSQVRFIASATTGDDHIDFDFCRKHNIEVFVAKGCNASSVAQWVGAAIGLWIETKRLNSKDLTLGIVGYGNVGKEVEKIAKMLDIRVLLNDPLLEEKAKNHNFVSLQTIAQNSDIVTFHTPLTVEGEFSTIHLANRDFFNKIKPNSLIINAARGRVVDEKELLSNYKRGKIGGFVLDCWENEPNISLELLRNAFLATPHIAGYSADGKANATNMCVRALSRFFSLEINDFTADLPQKKSCYCRSENVLKLLSESYDILTDSEKLKHLPDKFEFFRNHYPIRREIEFSIFTAPQKKV
ncbi:MAG: 4-phosphoerythronate dehydrogenase [Prevotellaceae bacterium]|nr:4-phosphoerythronate dehydrogenase [Prevotellaceae bacterium]